MMSRQAKAAFYAVAGPLMLVNGIVYRNVRAPRRGTVRVQLGPGQKNYLPGWINVDANMFTARCDVWADLRNRLPFPDDSVDAMYSYHVVEHLPDLHQHLRDVFRCLKPGGVYRVGGPNGDNAIAKFVQNDAKWFGEFPDKRGSIGGRFENMIFCRREHLTILTFSFLEEIMSALGFTQLRVCKPIVETHYPALFQQSLAKEWESDLDCPHSLVVEAVKPGAARAS